MRLNLLIPVVLAVSAVAFVAGPFPPKARQIYDYDTITYTKRNGLHYIEHKLEPEFKYGDMVAFLSCNLTNSTGHFVGQATEWYKNNTAVGTDSNFIIMKNNTLKIESPKRIHSGVYVARHKVWKNNVLSSHNCSVRYFAKPLILDFPKSVYLQEGADLELKCDVKGYPPAVAVWFRQGLALRPSVGSSHLMLYDWNNVKHAYLAIKSIHPEEAGDYTCQAYSAYFNYSVSKHVLVRVSGKMAFLWPLLGIFASAVLIGVITAVHEANANKLIKREEARLYRESFLTDQRKSAQTSEKQMKRKIHDEEIQSLKKKRKTAEYDARQLNIEDDRLSLKAQEQRCFTLLERANTRCLSSKDKQDQVIILTSKLYEKEEEQRNVLINK